MALVPRGGVCAVEPAATRSIVRMLHLFTATRTEFEYSRLRSFSGVFGVPIPVGLIAQGRVSSSKGGQLKRTYNFEPARIVYRLESIFPSSANRYSGQPPKRYRRIIRRVIRIPTTSRVLTANLCSRYGHLKCPRFETADPKKNEIGASEDDILCVRVSQEAREGLASGSVCIPARNN